MREGLKIAYVQYIFRGSRRVARNLDLAYRQLHQALGEAQSPSNILADRTELGSSTAKRPY